MYRSPAPGEPPFVREGDKVKKGQAVCIVEAMKLMNEIEVPAGGGEEGGGQGGHVGLWPGGGQAHVARTRPAPASAVDRPAPAPDRPAARPILNSSPQRPRPAQPPPQTEVAGEVVKILIDNGTPVTPGMPIMIIKP
jgi:pyruvate/2-oxoglutarate dehydrogenase complex dihydrolipoamide acyltransferase (E2) component